VAPTTNQSRDHVWLALGAAVMVAVAVLAGLLAASPATTTKVDADGADGPAGAETSPSPDGTGDDGRETKPDRVPPEALLPNMVALPAEELLIEGSGRRRALRFAAILANTGTGPLQVSPIPALACPAAQRYVEQRVFLDDGSARYERRRDRSVVKLPGGCMLFHPTHEHWHFDSTAGYALTDVTGDLTVVERNKISFCLRDSEPLRAATERTRRAYGECERDKRQGISVGWADRYDASLDGQRLPLPRRFVDGQYCLRIEVDPYDLFTESDETDNDSAVVVDISGRQIQAVPDQTC
jgi:hypothetical protein